MPLFIFCLYVAKAKMYVLKFLRMRFLFQLFLLDSFLLEFDIYFPLYHI